MEISHQLKKVLEATHGGVSAANLLAFAKANKLYGFDDDDYDTNDTARADGISYDAEANVVDFTGVIVDDELVAWLGGGGFASPSMLKGVLAKVKPGYAMQINSPGGSVFPAIEMVSKLRANAPDLIVITGIAASCAALIALVSEKRMAGNEMATIMFHAPYGFFAGNAAELLEAAAILQGFESSMIDFIESSATKKIAASIKEVFDSGKDKFYTAKEATAAGILQGVLQKGEGDPNPNEPKPDDASAAQGRKYQPDIIMFKPGAANDDSNVAPSQSVKVIADAKFELSRIFDNS